MNVGGTEKALLSMLEEIPLDQYEVTLLMLEKYGEFLNNIPKKVTVKYLEGYDKLKSLISDPPFKVIKNSFKQGRWRTGLWLLAIYIWCKCTGERTAFYYYLLKNNRGLQEQYDLAIAYAGPMEFISYLVLHKINAKKKVQWIHFDITKIGFNIRFARKVYKKFDKIFVISNEGKNKLIQALPELKDKVEVFFNIIRPELIRAQGDKEKGFQDSYTGIRLLTVGRLSQEKGQDQCIEAVARLHKDGYKIRWYAVGEGKWRAHCEQLAKSLGIEKECIFLGSKLNPYPYMKECDIYIQPSRHEGYCITLAEAKCFGSPIVTTDFTGAREQIEPYETGIIVEEGCEGIYKGIKELLDNRILYEQIRNNLRMNKVEQTNQLLKLFKIMDPTKSKEGGIENEENTLYGEQF